MSYIGETLHHLLLQTAFVNLSVGNLIMVLAACGFYISDCKGYGRCFSCPFRLACCSSISIPRLWNRADCCTILPDGRMGHLSVADLMGVGR